MSAACLVKGFSASASQQHVGFDKPSRLSYSLPTLEGLEIGKRVQRVRIGLTGLAFVFLLVLLGAVFTSPSNEAPITPNLIETQLSGGNQASPSTANQAQPKEPLAELGVAPGNADDDNSAQPARR
ncbi:MAG TPA: hypothetical protein VGA98_05795 [Allosphingosinicella sp.]